MIKAALLVGDAAALPRRSAPRLRPRTPASTCPARAPASSRRSRSWRPLTKAYVSFGQGISVTPLQLARAVARGGQRRPPADALRGRGGRPRRGEIERHAPRARPTAPRPVSPRPPRARSSGLLERVVTDGTGKRGGGRRLPGRRQDRHGAEGRWPAATRHRSYMPSFVGFAPADHPAMVGVVTIDEPHGCAYHGGQVAAPVFAAIARAGAALPRGPPRARAAGALAGPGHEAALRAPGPASRGAPPPTATTTSAATELGAGRPVSAEAPPPPAPPAAPCPGRRGRTAPGRPSERDAAAPWRRPRRQRRMRLAELLRGLPVALPAAAGRRRRGPSPR